jgi:hypothetical protein
VNVDSEGAFTLGVDGLAFGRESLLGFCPSGGALPFNAIAISGTGHIAVIGILQGDIAHTDNKTLSVFPPGGPAILDSLDARPCVNITILDDGVSNKPLKSLSAGEAHFSFIVKCDATDRRKYNRIWSIRTDSRSVDDSGWARIEEHLEALEDTSWLKITRESDDFQLFCAETEDDEEFDQCSSGGWFAIARSSTGSAWTFPFGRALMIIPDLPNGLVECFEDICQVSAGINHIAVIKEENEQYQVWTLGLNDHGQCGYPESYEGNVMKNEDGWHMVYEAPRGRILQNLVCGKWNTFFVECDLLEREDEDKVIAH